VKTFALVVIAVVLLAVVGWWLAFGTLSPCESLRGEMRRVGQQQAGVIGKGAMDLVARLKGVDDYTPMQCAGKALRLKAGGKDALEDVLRD
jgi:hypothetical protein